MLEASGVTDLTTGGTASQSSTFSSFVAANAIDDLTTTLAGTNVSGNPWLSVELLAPAAVKRMRWLTRNANLDWLQFPRIGAVQRSDDGVVWVDEWTFQDVVADRFGWIDYYAPGEYAAPAGTHRYYGIRWNAMQSGTAFGVREVAFNATPGGVDIATGGRGLASAAFSAVLPQSAFDNGAAEFGGPASFFGGILAYELPIGGEQPLPAEIVITARGSLPAQAPVDFDLVYADRNGVWTTHQNFTTPATWIGGEVRTFTVTP